MLVFVAFWSSAEAFSIDANLSYPSFTVPLAPLVDRQGENVIRSQFSVNKGCVKTAPFFRQMNKFKFPRGSSAQLFKKMGPRLRELGPASKEMSELAIKEPNLAKPSK